MAKKDLGIEKEIPDFDQGKEHALNLIESALTSGASIKTDFEGVLSCIPDDYVRGFCTTSFRLFYQLIKQIN